MENVRMSPPLLSLEDLTIRYGDRAVVRGVSLEVRDGEVLGLIGGTLTMEALFSLPGLGGLTLEAIRGRDYPVVQSAVMLIAGFVVLVNVATAGLHRWADPRLARQLPREGA